MTGNNYIVAGAKSWSRRVFDEVISTYPGRWQYVNRPDDLDSATVSRLAPRYIFFLHWSWKVPSKITSEYECVCFHMTDVPYGRGGSPLQNLIVRGHRDTKLTALRMEEGLDSGPVYLKEGLSLEGSAEEIFIRASYLAADMIRRIIDERPVPRPQSGEVVVFKRRSPAESEIGELSDLQALHDFVRMLDAEGYPRAFLEQGAFRYEFSRASLRSGSVVADVKITSVEGGKP